MIFGPQKPAPGTTPTGYDNDIYSIKVIIIYKLKIRKKFIRGKGLGLGVRGDRGIRGDRGRQK